jgi:cytochrome P450
MAMLGEAPKRAEGRQRREWPGPRRRGLFGCLRAFQQDQLNFLRAVWRSYGDYVRIPTVPGYDMYLLADPAAVEHVLVKNHKNYGKMAMLTRPIRLVIGNGLFASEGDFWLRQRRLSQPAFLRSALVRLAERMTSAVDGFVRTWQAEADGRTVDMTAEMTRLVLHIAAGTMFGADVGPEADAIAGAQRAIFELVRHKLDNPLSAPLWMPTRRNRAFHEAKGVFDAVVLRLIEARRRSRPAGNDVLDLLLAARDEESGTGMSDQQLRDEVMTLLFAGLDTTTAGILWAWHLLAGHPEVQEDLHDQVAARLQGRPPTADDLPHLPLASAVLEEALRLYPPAPGLPRVSAEADEIQGYPIPAKAIVTVSQWLIHRHPAYWDEPDAFRPERFLPGHGKERPKLAYFPFGAGPRGCIGNTFASIESALILAALAQRFHFRPADDRAVELDTTFVLRPKGALKMAVRKRG